MKWLFLLLVLVWRGSDAANFTFTYEMAIHCKEYLCQKGYSYDVYYDVSSDLTTSPIKKNAVFEMHIAIQAASNGHILLSPVPFPDHNDPVYEIVVGGGGNRFTELRRNLKRNAKASLRTEKILSAVELRGFYIRIDDGLIEFGEEGSALPLISFQDVYPLDIKFFSFAAWNGVEAKFLYDCPSPGVAGSNLSIVEHSKKIERNLSSSEQLKREKLQDRPAHMPPLPIVPVTLEAKISSVSYNALEAKLTTRMTLLMQWTDESLAWNPDKYNGIANVTYRQGQIWRPTFHVYNSDNLNALKTTGYELITMQSTGAAMFHFRATVNTWCYSETGTFNRWPHDEYSCSIVIQPWEAHETIVLSTLEDTTELITSILSDEDDVLDNEWKMTELREFIVTAAKWNKVYPLQLNTTHQSDRFVLTLTLQRRPTNYNMAFYTPLMVLIIFVLMSFWSEPLQMSRVWFYAGSAVFICTGLCFIDYLIPCHTIPTILVLYITVLAGILVALILQVMMMTAVAEKLWKTKPMNNLLCARWFRALFCLPPIKACRSYNRVNEGFSELEDDEMATSAFAPNGNIEEMHAEDTRKSEKEEFAEAIDKICFVGYSVLYAAMLAAHY